MIGVARDALIRRRVPRPRASTRSRRTPAGRPNRSSRPTSSSTSWATVRSTPPAPRAGPNSPHCSAATGDRVRVFYLATGPDLFAGICSKLEAARPRSTAASRVVLEKPIGHDRAAPPRSTTRSASVFDEDQIFRIDHYLGKETVQNLHGAALRQRAVRAAVERRATSTTCRSPWPRPSASSSRGGYYDDAGALRDMVQNHLLQLLCLVAMEPPVDASTPTRCATRSSRCCARCARSTGADVARRHGARPVPRRRRSTAQRGAGLPARSWARPTARTETFVALKAEVDNWRWAGVPFYLRTGKRLPERVSEIVVQFKHDAAFDLRRRRRPRSRPTGWSSACSPTRA